MNSNYLRPAFLAALLAFALVGSAYADPGKPGKIRNKHDVERLIFCYAAGTDAIGDATTNPDPLAAGLAIYHECFTDDAEFRVWFPQQAFDAQKFPNPDVAPPTPPSPVIGPEAWAQFVNDVFRANGYDFTQHIISNVEVAVHGRHALLTAYLNATHVGSGTDVGGPSHCVAVANGTYSLVAEKKRGRWKATRLDLTLITFNPVFESGPGCGG